MGEFLFFPNNQDRSDLVQAFRTEIDSSRKFIELLKDRAEEITGTDVDLSCAKPYNSYQTAQAVSALSPQSGIDLGIKLDPDEDVAIMQLGDLSAKELQRYFTAITLGYRQAALNILLGIGTHYKKAEGILPDFGPSRTNSRSFRDEMLERKAIPVISNKAWQKTECESDLWRLGSLKGRLTRKSSIKMYLK